jgi:transposase
MARYKHIDTGPRLLAIDLSKQLLPGTFEHALNHLIDHEIDLSHFDKRYKNDAVGASAYPPAMLLKVVLFAYSQGIISSRGIERACREHVIFVALSGESCPHFTTIADFVSSSGEDIAKVFASVLYLCQGEGLIGREMFAIDGVKLPSNASKRKSGTREEFKKQVRKLERAAKTMLDRHRAADAKGSDPDRRLHEDKRIERMSAEAKKLKQWLKHNPCDRTGPTGGLRKSNRTDNDSAKMATDKGVIQGFCGVAAVDAKHQVIVEARALGSGSEQEALLPVVSAMKGNELLTPASIVTADAGYHSEENLNKLNELNVQALIADNDMRKRDERFAEQSRHKPKSDPLHDKSREQTPKIKRYTPADFHFDPSTHTCVCPAGQHLYRNGARCTIGRNIYIKFSAAQRACFNCTHRKRCLRHPQKTKTRQVVFFLGKAETAKLSFTDRMKQRIDTEQGRDQYAKRFATVEPVFANIRHNKGMNRFTLRGHAKVEGQWKLFCLVHNIEKIAHYRDAKRQTTR